MSQTWHYNVVAQMLSAASSGRTWHYRKDDKGDGPDLQAGACEGERVGGELRDAGGHHARRQDGVRRWRAVIVVQQPLLNDLKRRYVHTRVWQDANLQQKAGSHS